MIGRWILRIVWMLVLMTGTLIISFFLLAETGDLPTAVLTDHLTSHFGTPKVWMLIGGLLIALSVFLRRHLRRIIQIRSDKQASQIMNELVDGAEAPDSSYLVYLRAFETTGKLKAPWFMFAHDLGLQQLRSSEQESYLAWAVRKLGPLMALGEPGEHLGAGRIKTTDADWQQMVRRLVEKAKAVLIIPSDRPGTLWEVQHLRAKGLLSKTIFIMPPEARGFDWRARWHDARKALGDFGASLPEYDRHGLMFRLDPEGQVLDINHLPVWRPRRFRKAVQRFLSGKPKNSNDPSRVSKAVRAARRHWFFGYLSGLFRMAATGGFLFLLATAEPVLRPSGTAEPWSTLWDRYSAAIERQQLGEQINNRLWLNPDYQRMVADLDPQQEESLRGELIWRGLPWTRTEQLRTYFSGLAEAYSHLSPHECRRLVDGELALANLNHAWVRVDPDIVRDFSKATVAAIEAGVANTTLPEVRNAQITAAAQAFLDGLSPEERVHYTGIETSLMDEVPDTDLCWLMITTYKGFSRIDDEMLQPLFMIIDRDDVSISTAASVTNPSVDTALSESPLQQLLESPAYQMRTTGLDEDARVGVLIELMNIGLTQLDDKALLTYYAIFGRVLSALELNDCAAVATGNLALDNTTAFEELPEPLHQAFNNVLYTAARMAVEEQPIPVLEDDTLEKVVVIFLATFEAEELQRFERLGSDPESVTKADICWLLRKKIERTKTLETPHKEVWARALILGHF